MNILIIGEQERAAELVKTLGPGHNIDIETEFNLSDGYDIVIDMDADDRHGVFTFHHQARLIIVSAVKRKLADVVAGIEQDVSVVGMNLLPTMTGRELKEVSFLNGVPEEFKAFAEANNWQYLPVKDTVGMVTPRVLAMIINEAANTLQEGTATKEDIDKGMMLGTNYPMGPLAWCDKIGAHHIVDILQALHTETGNERYKVCKLLLEKNERKEKFY